MTKEQETIERLNSLIKINKDFFESQGNMIINKRDILAIETVLNMLKEKDEQIAKYEKIYKEYDCYRWVKELEKKDKIIDLMARAIDNYDSQLVINTFKDREHVKQYFKEIAEESSSIN